MLTQKDIHNFLERIGIKHNDTVLIHTSMRSIGEVEGGTDTVIDALMEYMKDGLLVLPTHTWAQMNTEYTIFNVKTEPSCVGILTNILYKHNIRAVLDSEKSINLGTVYESVVAAELKAHGHKIYYYDNRKKGEVDYLVDDYDTLSVRADARSSSCTTMYTALTVSGRIRCSMLAIYWTVGLYSMAPPPFLWMALCYHISRPKYSPRG